MFKKSNSDHWTCDRTAPIQLIVVLGPVGDKDERFVSVALGVGKDWSFQQRLFKMLVGLHHLLNRGNNLILSGTARGVLYGISEQLAFIGL